MKKTAGQIEADIFALIKASDLIVTSPGNKPIKGKLYRKGTRPIKSKEEDAVVIFKTGLDGQIQTGALVINIFVPNIDNGSGAKVMDVQRCTELEAIANNILASLKPSDYKFKLGTIIQSFESEGQEQHYISIDLRFELKTF
jgi:hypothetical protein